MDESIKLSGSPRTVNLTLLREHPELCQIISPNCAVLTVIEHPGQHPGRHRVVHQDSAPQHLGVLRAMPLMQAHGALHIPLGSRCDVRHKRPHDLSLSSMQAKQPPKVLIY